MTSFRNTEQPVGLPLNVGVDRLLLDDQNPRLTSGAVPGQPLSQRDLVKRLWSEMAVDEVAISIAQNGYYPEERLLVVEAPDGNYTVVEGNRRLAAVLLLLDDSLRAFIKADELPAMSDDRRLALSLLPVSVYPSRESLWSYLGFRHINGTRPWDAYSKARYVAEVHEKYGVDLPEIAERIGDRHSTVVRLYRGLKVLEQAEDQAGFDVQDRVRTRFAFSHLYTAMQYAEFQKFLGVTDSSSLRRYPVPKSKLAELSELMLWLYGRRSSGILPVVRTQAPDLGHLRNVVASSRGLSLLRSGRTLDAALEASVGEERRFREALTRANEELIHAMGTVTNGYQGESDLHDLMKGIVAVVARLDEEVDARASEVRSSRRSSRQSHEPA